MISKAIVWLALLGMLAGYACDTPEAPSSSSSSAAAEAALPKDKLPPTSKEDSTKNATAAIDAWVKLVDEAQYPTAWEESGAWLKQVEGKDAWVKQIGAIRNAYGPLVSRTVKTVDYKSQIPRMPPGIYVTITYDSSFANVKDAYEEIGATYEDKQWRPLGYYVGAKPPPKASPNATSDH
jgi:hypothetical protein